jgi:hypothetical protein
MLRAADVDYLALLMLFEPLFESTTRHACRLQMIVTASRMTTS